MKELPKVCLETISSEQVFLNVTFYLLIEDENFNLPETWKILHVSTALDLICHWNMKCALSDYHISRQAVYLHILMHIN